MLGNLPALRRHNDALVLGLVRAAGADGVSRGELAEAAGLTPQAVSKITGRLGAEGLLAEAGRRTSTGGKPRTALRVEPSARHAVGLHLDRDELTAVVVDLTGAVVAELGAGVGLGAGVDVVVERAAEVVGALVRSALAGGRAAEGAATGSAAAGSAGAGSAAARSAGVGRAGVGRAWPDSLVGVGVASPGPLDHGAGVLGRVTGLPPWDGFPLRRVFAERLVGLPVALDKDTNAAALALTGTAGGSFAYLHLATGLGAGLVLDGDVYRGPRTGAGEFGHQVVQLDGPRCECGRRGCLEAVCLAAVARGDTAEAARVLGVGAAGLVRLLDVDRLLLGGRTVLGAPEPYLAGVRAELGAAAVGCDLAPGGGRLVAEGAAELALAPLFGRAAAN
ncbi:ROK family transcriptional regulator [Streptomyces boninensis]|uniref:ROK family transcriptional regulator n=1 Tax=Streptomyces boninensis TaxID=2039455 RepID=UPI003B20F867